MVILYIANHTFVSQSIILIQNGYYRVTAYKHTTFQKNTLASRHLEPKQLVSITTDSASNIRLACQLLKWKRLSCFGRNLDLAINKGLDDQCIDRVINLCRKVVAAFSHSWKRKRDLQEVQEQKKLPLKQLKGDVSTRWGSKAAMIERILEQQEAIRVVLAQDRKTSHLVLSWQDFDVLQSVMAAVKPFQDPN